MDGLLRAVVGLFVASVLRLAAAEAPAHIEPVVALAWPTTAGNSYQLQEATAPDGPWSAAGDPVTGVDQTHSRIIPRGTGIRHYRVMETIPATEPVASLPVNGGFEAGNGSDAADWIAGASQPPQRTGDDARSGSFSLRCALLNVGAAPSEGLLEQRVSATGETVLPDTAHTFSFWAKQVSLGPSYIQQVELQWLDASGGVIGGTGLVGFSTAIGTWEQVTFPNLVSPSATADARIRFRFVTGAVDGGYGEVLLDDVALDAGIDPGPGSPEESRVVAVTREPMARINWATLPGLSYEVRASADLTDWNALSQPAVGDGTPMSLLVGVTAEPTFYRVVRPEFTVQPPGNVRVIASPEEDRIQLVWTASPSPGVTGYRVEYGLSGGTTVQSLDVGNVTSAIISGLVPGETYSLAVVAIVRDAESAAGEASVVAQPGGLLGIVPLYHAMTLLEPATSVETSTALITRVGDRARDRHAREAIYHSYDHYLPWYWEERTVGIEIIDRVAKGGTEITFNTQTLTPLSAPEFRAFFRGIGTVAEYHGNYLAPLVGPNLYSQTLSTKLPENRPLQVGDRIEIEVSQFIAAPRNGRSNYYGTAILYVVGEGIVPWEGAGPLLDSYPLPENAWLGGKTTLPYQYSNEPEHRFKQTAGNLAPENAQPFMLGRRLHHTDFGDGSHSEAGNPVFTEQIGKLGPRHINRSCVACHTNNGRALPPAIGQPMLQSVVKVGANASGDPHPVLGSVLQPVSSTGEGEGSAKIASYTTVSGSYGDGTSYTLRKPNYAFEGTAPEFFSVRLAPPLVGLGLLEAVDEESIIARADPSDLDMDGIAGWIRTVTDPETGDARLGRFTAKSGQARLSHQIASALNTDMGMRTAVFPVLDGESEAGTPDLTAEELDQMTRYVALLGVGARRDLDDPDALRGEQLFESAGCVRCHTPEMTTSSFHPLAELRGQTIRPFTDLLLHDLGSGLADNMGEGGAGGSEWRTAPLWGIGLTAGVSGGEAYLHDGRARTLEEAILWHGGEAEAAKEAFRNLPAEDRAALVAFLRSL